MVGTIRASGDYKYLAYTFVKRNQRIMLRNLASHWWVLVLRGLASIIFAIVAFTQPGLAFEALVYLLGALFLVDGAIAAFLGLRMRGEDDDWWIVLLEGLLGLGLGIATFAFPAFTANLLLLFISLWCLVTGVFEISTAIRLRREIDNEWLLGLAGVVSIALGVLMLVNPTAGAISVTWWIGAYALIFGILLLGLGWKVRRVWLRMQERNPDTLNRQTD